MKLQLSLLVVLALMVCGVNAQQTTAEGAFYVGEVASMRYVEPLASRTNLIPAEDRVGEAQDGRSSRPEVIPGKDPQTANDYFASNPHPMTGKIASRTPSIVFDASASNSQPTDPSLAVGPNHVISVFNTGFVIFNDKLDPANNNSGQLSVTNIFSGGGCCDLTVSYDSAADRWVLSYLFVGAGAEIAVSDGPDPNTAGWFVYSIPQINDYQKLSVWSDGYYITDNTGSSNRVWALERDALLAGDPAASIQGFNLPGIVTSGFFSPQALNVTDDNMPSAGNATIIYLQDDAWGGVTFDHFKIWTIDADFDNPGNSTVSAPTEIATDPFISVFDGGSFSNLTQPGGGIAIDALQATIMNQAQFRKFPAYNSALFNFVVDVDATSGEKAGVRWFELRQDGDGQPWTVYQEGTYTAPDTPTGGEKHAWHASLMMDGSGNIGMGYSAMTVDPSDPNPVRVSSYYTGRYASDPLGTMTIEEQLIANGNANIPGLRYGDYSKIDIDPVNDKTFWFINEYMNSGRKNVVGVFQITPNFNNDAGVVSIDTPVTGTLSDSEEISVTIFNYGLDPISDFDVTYQVDGGAVVTETFNGTIESTETAQFTFVTLADLSTVGQTYSITAATALGGDEDTGNDATTKEVTFLEPNDLGVTAITAPQSGTNLPADAEITVTITNFGGEPQSNFDVTFNLDGDEVTEQVAGPLAGNSELSYTFTQTVDLSAFGSYDLSVRTELPTDSDTSNDETSVTIINSNCEPGANCTLGDGIVRLQLENVDNNSGCDPGGYGNYTNLVVEFATPDADYDMTVTTGYGNQFVRTWIDFNDDFVFTSDELVVDNYEIADGQGAGSYTETMTLSIPAEATPGQHLMRVKTNWNAPVPDDACDETTYGETEDYLAEIGVLTFGDVEVSSEDLVIVHKGNNQFDITMTSPNGPEKLELSVYNILGQQILNRRLESNNGTYNYQLNMSYVSAGVYMVQLGSSQGGLVKKIVVR